MKKKLLATLLCTAMTIGLVAGCGSSTQTSSGDTGDTSTAIEEAKTDTVTDTAADEEGE